MIDNSNWFGLDVGISGYLYVGAPKLSSFVLKSWTEELNGLHFTLTQPLVNNRTPKLDAKGQ